MTWVATYEGDFTDIIFGSEGLQSPVQFGNNGSSGMVNILFFGPLNTYNGEYWEVGCCANAVTMTEDGSFYTASFGSA